MMLCVLFISLFYVFVIHKVIDRKDFVLIVVDFKCDFSSLRDYIDGWLRFRALSDKCHKNKLLDKKFL